MSFFSELFKRESTKNKEVLDKCDIKFTKNVKKILKNIIQKKNLKKQLKII